VAGLRRARTLSGAGDLLGWAGFWPGPVGLPAAFFLFFSFSFLVFLFVSKPFQNIFKTLQTKHGVF
jgi:hypothetical protein